MDQFVIEVFPIQPTWENSYYRNKNEMVLFTISELHTPAKNHKTWKVPGPDGIPSQMIKRIAQEFLRISKIYLLRSEMPGP